MAKRVSKKSLEYIRPQPGTFTLESFPGHEFRFRKISIDDEAWCVEKLGVPIHELVSREKVQAADLCRLYFHLLVEDDKKLFFPVEEDVTDYDTGEKKKETIAGSRLFMRAVSGGVELILIGDAFLKTFFSSRPITDLPDDLKKTLLALVEKGEKAKATKGEPEKETQTP